MSPSKSKIINPLTWAKAVRDKRPSSDNSQTPPIVYVAHPVAARPGEHLATCTRCKAEHAYTLAEPIDLRTLCECIDAPVWETSEPKAIVAHNLSSALAWWSWLHRACPSIAFVMPWFVNVSCNGEGDRELIERGLRDDEAIAARCDGLVHCGMRISSGMRREHNAITAAGGSTFQLFNARPPVDPMVRLTWQEISL